MPTAASNARRAWTNADVALLKKLVEQSTPPGLIAYKLGRSEAAMRAKVRALGLGLEPARRGP